MNRHASPSPGSVKAARRLLQRSGLSGGEIAPEVARAALGRACSAVSRNLRDAMGDDGCAALLGRALALAEARHGVLASVRHVNGRGISLDGLSAAIEAHGVVTVAAAIEAMLAALLDVLGRLIGEDMAVRLMDPEALPRAGGGERAP
jgi:hypothetical protein